MFCEWSLCSASKIRDSIKDKEWSGEVKSVSCRSVHHNYHYRMRTHSRAEQLVHTPKWKPTLLLMKVQTQTDTISFPSWWEVFNKRWGSESWCCFSVSSVPSQNSHMSLSFLTSLHEDRISYILNDWRNNLTFFYSTLLLYPGCSGELLAEPHLSTSVPPAAPAAVDVDFFPTQGPCWKMCQGLLTYYFPLNCVSWLCWQ